MTRNLLSLATAFFFLTHTSQAADYYFGQNGDYAPDYYSVPKSYRTAPPPTSPPPPATTVSVYGNNPQLLPPDDISFWRRGPYFNADIGPAFFQDSRMKQYNVPANDPIQYKMGGTIGIASGFVVNRYLAADLDLGFWGARVDRIKFFTFDHASLYEIPITANVIAMLPLQNGRIMPYLGGGAGGSVAIFDAQNFTTPANPTIDGSEADVVFAGQVFAGVRFRLNPKMWLGAEYRFFCTTQPRWDYPNDFKLSIGGLEADALLFTFAWRF